MHADLQHMRSQLILEVLVLIFFVALLQSAAFSQKRNNRSDTRVISQDTALVGKVDRLNERLSDVSREIGNLKQQSLKLSEKIVSLRTESKENDSSPGYLVLTIFLALSTTILGVGVIVLYWRLRREGQSEYRNYLVPSENPEIKNSLDILTNELKYLKNQHHDVEESLKYLQKKITQSNTSLSVEKLSEWTPALQAVNEVILKRTIEASPIQELVSAYNAGLRNESDRTRFREHYQISRIGVLNAMERRRDSSLPPIFQSASDGDFYAIEIADQGRMKYGVVPRFDLTLQESNFAPGAIGIVFKCSGFNLSMRYRYFRLLRPAFFGKAAGENWNHIEDGELDIGEGE